MPEPTNGRGRVPNETSAPQLLEEIVGQAERAGASDIHLQMLGPSAQVSGLWVGGVLLVVLDRLM